MNLVGLFLYYDMDYNEGLDLNLERGLSSATFRVRRTRSIQFLHKTRPNQGTEPCPRQCPESEPDQEPEPGTKP